MSRGSEGIRAAYLRHEWLVVSLLVLAVFVSIPLARGGLQMSSDALNHHIYLGWEAVSDRFGRDYMAAGSQAYQFPYLYWPAYKLAISGATGLQAGLVLAALQSIIALPLWILVRACMPGATLFDAAMRLAGVLLALMTSAILMLVDSTANDVLAAIPMTWAIAAAVQPLASASSSLGPRQHVALSGALAGLAVTLKLSNGPLAILLPLLWLLPKASAGERLGRLVLGGAATLLAFFLCYGYWGWKLWTWFGNPVYPFYDDAFAPLRALAHWQP